MYNIVKLKNVSVMAEDWLSSFVFENGALGMSENLKYAPKPGTDEVQSLISEIRDLDVYFDQLPAPQFYEEVQSRYPEIQIHSEAKENEDWMEGWKKHFKAFELVDGYWVVPSWLKAPPEARRVLAIDPGMAFGTGTHETTSMMAQALYWVRERAPKGQSLIDVGTGTGILAILGSFIGYTDVAATDTDLESQRVSQENFVLNGVSAAITEKQIQDMSGSYDVVLANIIEGVLVLIQQDLYAKVKPGGHLLVSGILVDNEEEFKRDFVLPAGAEWVHRTARGEWLCLVAKWH